LLKIVGNYEEQIEDKLEWEQGDDSWMVITDQVGNVYAPNGQASDTKLGVWVLLEGFTGPVTVKIETEVGWIMNGRGDPGQILGQLNQQHQKSFWGKVMSPVLNREST
jgi:hypothetical protein